MLLAALVSLGTGLWLCGASVRYRDIPFALPFAVQLWFYVTPVIYPVAKLPEPYRALLALNPMTSVIDGFRWSLLSGRTPLAPEAVAASVAVTAVLLFAGIVYFRAMERRFADVI